MNNIIEKELNIEDMIYEIRGKQVMLDSDLAKLYNVETKRINETVKNNPRKFLERFSWILLDDELKFFSSRSKFSTLNKSNNKRGYNIKYLPRVIDIFNEAKKDLIIIDSYADKKLLDIIKDLNIKVTIITKEKGKLNKTIIDEYNKEFSNLKVIYNDSFHDRYFIIDRNIIYHSGTSINYMGMRVFSINLLSDDIAKKLLLDKIDEFNI